MRKHLLATAATALLLSGCSLMPTYERPAAPVPATYGASATDSTSAPQTLAPPAWKDYFTDPRLQQLIALALDNNRDLRMATLAIEQARAQWQIQRSAQWPQIGLGANAARAPNSSGNLSNTYSVGGILSAWELDFFGRLGSLKEQALAQYLASEEGRNAAQTSLIAAVASAWLALQADEEGLDISRRTLATREESLALMKLRLDVGTASELDYRQVQSLTEAARVTLAQQQRQRALNENALALLLGQPLPPELRASLPGSRLVEVPSMAALPAGLPSDLLAHRPDIRQAELQLKAANANIGAARAAFFRASASRPRPARPAASCPSCSRAAPGPSRPPYRHCCPFLMPGATRPGCKPPRPGATWLWRSTKNPSKAPSVKSRTPWPARARSMNSCVPRKRNYRPNRHGCAWRNCATTTAWPAT